MPNIYGVEITVKEITKGKCHAGHKVGDYWLCKRDKTPGGMCVGAFNAITPQLRTLIHGGSHYWDKDEDVSYISCPDRNVQVIYELKRLRPE
jgi:uncharacterized repeat protein (TIGR04076 family)